MKRLFTYLFLVSALMLSFSNLVYADCGKLMIASQNWASAELMAELDKAILEKGFGCKVKLIPGSTMSSFTEMDKNKKPLMNPEQWSNAVYTQLKKAVAKGRMHVANEGPISDLGEGWWITPATAKKYPNLKTVLDVIDNPDLFGGKFIGCPAGWGCNIANNNLFKAFNMKKKGWTIVDPGSAAGLDRSMAKAANNNKNWFGYYWNPTSMVGKYNMVKLDWGVSWAGRENWDNCIMRENCSNPKKTSWTQSAVYSVVTDRFKNNAGSKVMNYLNNRTIPGDVMNNMLVYMAENQTSGASAAKEFLKRNQEIWTSWVSYRVAKNIGNSVDITMIAKKKTEEEKKITKKEKKKQVEVAQTTQEEFKPKKLNKDTIPPTLEVAETMTVDNSTYYISGKVSDKGSKKLFIEVDEVIETIENGKFNIKRFSPVDEEVEITAIDQWGNKTSKIVKVKVIIKETEVVEKLDPLNPSLIQSKKNNNIVALIIGIEKYDQTPAANFANLDAKYFYEYVRKAFGASQSNIKLLIDEDANLIKSLGIINKWLPGKIKKNQTELIIFFAGHGLASSDGKELYLLPQDSDPDLLSRTALSRTELFQEIISLNPKSVTMFMDTCYSGISRDEKMLLASARPIRIVADEQDGIPDNFTIFSASQLNQISSGLKEANHGIFSYYLMKGLEGKADSNNDKKITNGELLAYMDQNVSQKASELGRQQNPSLAGDSEKVLLKY